MRTLRDQLHYKNRKKKQKRRSMYYRKVVMRGLHILTYLGISPKRQGRILGFDASKQGELANIKVSILRARNIDVQERMELLITIFAKADALFAPMNKSKGALSWWWRKPIQELGNRTPLAALSSGQLSDLVDVNAYLSRMTG